MKRLVPLVLLSTLALAGCDDPEVSAGRPPAPPTTAVAGVIVRSSNDPTPTPTARASQLRPAVAPKPVGEPTAPRSGAALDAAVAAAFAPHVPRLGRDNVGIVVEPLGGGTGFVHNPDQRFASGSVYKLAVAVDVLRRVDAGEMRLDDQFTVQRQDRLEAEPEGGLPLGETVTVRRALEAMMSVSSNAAGFALMRQVGRGKLNTRLQTLGLRSTSVPLVGEPGDTLDDEYAVTSAADMARLLRSATAGNLLSTASRTELNRLLAIPEPIDPLVGALPQSAVLSKTGQLEDATNIAAVVQTRRGPVVLSVFTKQVGPGEASGLIADLGRAIYSLS